MYATSQHVKHHTCWRSLILLTHFPLVPPLLPPPHIHTHHTRSKETLNRILSNHESSILLIKDIDSTGFVFVQRSATSTFTFTTNRAFGMFTFGRRCRYWRIIGKKFTRSRWRNVSFFFFFFCFVFVFIFVQCHVQSCSTTLIFIHSGKGTQWGVIIMYTDVLSGFAKGTHYLQSSITPELY